MTGRTPLDTDAALGGLYPFLRPAHAEGGEARASSTSDLDTALVASLREKAERTRATIDRFVDAQAAELVAAARAMARAFADGGRLFTMGNGGSSCDAAHVAVEFMHPVTTGRPALPAINLVADVATLTALANDIGFDQVFSRALAAQARRGDVVVGVSTSGNSPNLVAGFVKAKEIGLATIALTGDDGGLVRACGAVDHCLRAPSDSVHRTQECHVFAYHVLWELVHALLAEPPRGDAR